MGKDRQVLEVDERRPGAMDGANFEKAAIALADQAANSGPSPRAFVYGIGVMALAVLVVFVSWAL